jgi:hypothetical protein
MLLRVRHLHVKTVRSQVDCGKLLQVSSLLVACPAPR